MNKLARAMPDRYTLVVRAAGERAAGVSPGGPMRAQDEALVSDGPVPQRAIDALAAHLKACPAVQDDFAAEGP